MINCINCCVAAFKDDYCTDEFCDKYRVIGNGDDFVKKYIRLPHKKGKWIALNEVFWTCSECKGYTIDALEKIEMNFCPNCGADLREEGV